MNFDRKASSISYSENSLMFNIEGLGFAPQRLPFAMRFCKGIALVHIEENTKVFLHCYPLCENTFGHCRNC